MGIQGGGPGSKEGIEITLDHILDIAGSRLRAEGLYLLLKSASNH